MRTRRGTSIGNKVLTLFIIIISSAVLFIYYNGQLLKVTDVTKYIRNGNRNDYYELQSKSVERNKDDETLLDGELEGTLLEADDDSLLDELQGALEAKDSTTPTDIIDTGDEVTNTDANDIDIDTSNQEPQSVTNCGCPASCDVHALEFAKYDYNNRKEIQCKPAVEYLMSSQGLSELNACRLASTQPIQIYNNTNTQTRPPCDDVCNPVLCNKLLEDDKPPAPFQRYSDVVVVTKVHSSEEVETRLMKAFCTFKAAYNRFVNYDIVIFTAVSWEEHYVTAMQELVHPAKLKVLLDGAPTLEERLANWTTDEIAFLYHRCGLDYHSRTEDLTWRHYCNEFDSHLGKVSLGYAWQAEFRSYHIWIHPILEKYKYMMWVDSDCQFHKTWDVDPMQIMIENGLNLLYDYFPAGATRNARLQTKIQKHFNTTVCAIFNTGEHGVFNPKPCINGQATTAHQVYGYFHITKLDFYREPKHLEFLRDLIIGDYHFSRQWDDQLAVTIVPALASPDKAWDLRRNGANLMISHHGKYDGNGSERVDRNIGKVWWEKGLRDKWDAGRMLCDWIAGG